MSGYAGWLWLCALLVAAPAQAVSLGPVEFVDPPLIRGSTLGDSIIVEVVNDGDSTACLVAAMEAPQGVAVEVEPSVFELGPSEIARLALVVQANGDAPTGTQYGLLDLRHEPAGDTCDAKQAASIDAVFEIIDPRQLAASLSNVRVEYDAASSLLGVQATVANAGNRTLRHDAWASIEGSRSPATLQLARDGRLQPGQSQPLWMQQEAAHPGNGNYEVVVFAAGTSYQLASARGPLTILSAGDDAAAPPDAPLPQAGPEGQGPDAALVVTVAGLVMLGAAALVFWKLATRSKPRQRPTTRVGQAPKQRYRQQSRQQGRMPTPQPGAEQGEDAAPEWREAADAPQSARPSRSRDMLEDRDPAEATEPEAAPPEEAEALGPAPKPAPSPRVVNLAFANPEDIEPLPNQPLEPEQQYDLMIDIGPHLPTSIVKDAARHAFPAHHLPERSGGHTLQILVASSDFKVDSSLHGYFLPSQGRGWSCSCNQHGNQCTGHGEPEPTRVAVRAPPAGPAEMRVTVYYRRNVVQSHQIRVQVGQAGDGPAQQAEVDFSLSHDLTDVEKLPEQTVNILTNDTGGSHRVVVNGADQEVAVMELTEAQVEAAITKARRRLFEIHIDGDPAADPSTWKDRLQPDNSKPSSAFQQDLEELALLGRDLWMALDQNAGLDGVQRLLAGQPGRIQVARTRSSTLHFPWSMVYDVPLDPQFGPLQLCATAQAVADGQGFADRCPPSPHPPNTLCPLAFWGLRHVIEQPPHLPDDRTLCLTITPGSAKPCLIAGTSKALGRPDLTRSHMESLMQALPEFAIETYDQFRPLTNRLSEGCVEVLYCYGHGGAEPQPYLDVGEGGFIMPRTLDFLRHARPGGLLWPHARPLVFMNACESGAFKPSHLVSLVDAFMRANAAAVVGTEVPISQQLAGEVATAFMRAFATNSTGQALAAARRQLLAKGNLMGLAYTVHGSSALRLGAA